MSASKLNQAATSLLGECLWGRLDAPQRTWLNSQIDELAGNPTETALHIAFGMVPRRLGKADLALRDADLAAAEQAMPGWNPQGWSVADGARVFLLSHVSRTAQNFAPLFRSLCETADVVELIALYRGLPLYANGQALLDQVGEGLRSNMRGVFEAIIHANPYPKLHFDEHRWNHMVLKALFVGSALAPILGLDQRANAELARMLCDFAQERRAAGRPAPFEIWRCVGPFAQGPMLDSLARALASRDATEQSAAALALAASPDPAAAQLLATVPTLQQGISQGRLSWATLHAV
ncbi:MAG: EboA domain-containing protein [Burkholderiaceae bacterium]